MHPPSNSTFGTALACSARGTGTGHGAQGTRYGVWGTGHGAWGMGHRARGTGHRARGTEHGARSGARQPPGRTSSAEAHTGPASPACKLMLRKRATLVSAAGEASAPLCREREQRAPLCGVCHIGPKRTEAGEHVQDDTRPRGPSSAQRPRTHGAPRGRTGRGSPPAAPGRPWPRPPPGPAQQLPAPSCSRTDRITEAGGPRAAQLMRCCYKRAQR